MSEIKQGVIIGFLGKTQDRFSEYQNRHPQKRNLKWFQKLKVLPGWKWFFRMKTLNPKKPNRG